MKKFNVMDAADLEIGHVFKADQTLYAPTNGEAKELRQHFGRKSGKPAAAPVRQRLEAGNYVVTAVTTETDYEKILRAPEDERDLMSADRSADYSVVSAIRLDANGTFNPKGQKVVFSPDHAHPVRQVKVVGKMQQTFVPAGKLKK